MKRYTEKRETSSRRFCRPHRMELLQGDIKYGPDIRLGDGTLIKTYLSSLIDDHSRFIVQSEFYDNQRQEVVEDTFHKAILKHGKCDACYLDNGTQYTTNRLHTALANAEVEIAYAPMNTETIKVLYQDIKPIVAHRVRIGAFCDKTPDIPVGMTGQVPETSRFLDALEKKYKKDHRLMANALSFGDYGKAGGSHV